MNNKAKYLLLAVLFLLINLNAQYNNDTFGLSLSATYTPTGRLFLNPNSIQKLLREENVELIDIYSGAIELRYRINESLIIGIGTEYIEKTSKEMNVIGFPSQLAGVEVEEGFRMVPIELSVYYFIPFSTESFKFFMGGGAGVYFGEYIREFADVSLENISREFSWGIHGRIGMDYLITDFFAVRGEMKFRDPDFKMESKYNKNSFEYKGTTRSLPTEPFATKVNIDGMTFVIGAVFHF